MKKYIPLAAIAVIAAIALVIWPNRPTTELTAFGAAAAQEGEVDRSLVREMVIGDPDAPVTVVEYASLTCPHCKNFHVNTYKQFKANYIDTGKVRFVFREVYFDRFGLWGAMVARCGLPGTEETDEAVLEAAQKRYFAIVDVLFEKQAEWLDSDSPAGIAANLAKIGRTAGLGAEQVNACMQDADLAQAMVTVYQENAEADQVQSTPTFIIDGEAHAGDKRYADFAALLDAALGE